MFSYLKALTEEPMDPISEAVLPQFECPPNKRKWPEETINQDFFKHDPTSHAEKKKSFFDMNLDPEETPLPAHNLKQNLPIQSGEMQLCNTRMNMMRTPDLERNFPEAPSLGPKSLDLELGSKCKSLKKKELCHDIDEKKDYGFTPSTFGELDPSNESSKCGKNDDSFVLTPFPSWLSSEGDQQEMIATICMRCCMLVMLCKSFPACPNCKFMHSSKCLERKKMETTLFFEEKRL